jgi:glycosyltransferase involved in cell wall biosynthesis
VQKNKVLFSVVIPTLNAGKWLSNCLGSLAAQSFKNFEVIVVDGGSADDTIRAVDFFRETSDLKLRWYQEQQLGVYPAMNLGYENALGSWCYFLGADDELHDPLVLQDIALELVKANADMVYGDVLMKSRSKRYCGEVTLDTLLFHKNIGHQAIFYSKALLERMGGYNDRYPVWADWDLNIRCFKTPGVKHVWLDRVVAVFDDQNGMSVAGDPVLSKELPKFSKGYRSYVPVYAKNRFIERLKKWLGGQ